MHRVLLSILAIAIACADDDGTASTSTTASSTSSSAEDSGTTTGGDTAATTDGGPGSSSESSTTTGTSRGDTTGTESTSTGGGGSTTDGGSSDTGAFDCELFGLNDGEAVCVGGEHSSEVALCLDGKEAYAECNFGYWCESQDTTHADCVCDLQADDLCPDGGECPEDPDCG